MCAKSACCRLSFALAEHAGGDSAMTAMQLRMQQAYPLTAHIKQAAFALTAITTIMLQSDHAATHDEPRTGRPSLAANL